MQGNVLDGFCVPTHSRHQDLWVQLGLGQGSVFYSVHKLATSRRLLLYFIIPPHRTKQQQTKYELKEAAQL